MGRKRTCGLMEHLLATWGYLALFVVTLLASLGIPVGSEIAMGYAGALASGQLSVHHHLQLVVVIAVSTLGELVGSSCGYLIGRFGGRPLVDRVGKFVLLTHKDLDRADAWFSRRGESVVFFGRFIPLVRSFISVAAGIGEMKVVRFVAFTLAACAIWCATLASIGYGLGSSWHHAIKAFSYVGYLAAAVVVIALALFTVHRVRQLRAERT